MEKRLYRSRTQRMVGGVCGGLAEYFDVDVTIVRVLTVALAFANGVGALAYVLLLVLVPEEPVEGGVTMSEASENPTPEPASQPAGPPADAAQPAAAAAPTYSAPTYAPPAEPVASPAPTLPASAPAQPAYTAPQPVTGRDPARDTRRGGVIGGIVLIVLGGIFLVSQFVPGIDIGKLWPLILIAIGVGIIVRRR